MPTLTPERTAPKTTAGTPDRVLHIFIDAWKKKFVEGRADRLEWSGSKFGAALIDWWIAQGAPPIHMLEEKLPQMPFTPPSAIHLQNGPQGAAGADEINTPEPWERNGAKVGQERGQ